jgi:hypothetical protein
VLDQKTLAQLMRCQLALDLENGCEPLGKQGSRGALFGLTLESYGYTFVAKGTVRAFKANLKHEGLIYRHLSEVQGQFIPVYVGNLSLACPYYLDVGVRIVHMLLMSYAGEQAQKDSIAVVSNNPYQTAETLKNETPTICEGFFSNTIQMAHCKTHWTRRIQRQAVDSVLVILSIES